jgi:hypothetical protein
VVVRWVRNLRTGLVFDVPEGHWSLTSTDYEVLPGPEPAPAPEEPQATPEKPARKRK